MNPVNHVSPNLATREVSAQFATPSPIPTQPPTPRQNLHHMFLMRASYQEFHATSRHSLSPFYPYFFTSKKLSDLGV